MIKIACHCGLNQKYYKCNEYYEENQDANIIKEKREQQLSCGNRCIKNVSDFIIDYEIIY